MRSTVSSAPTLRAFSTRASDRISRIASYTLQTSGPAPIAPPVITYGGGHRAGPVMECDLPDTRRCEAVRDGKSVSLTGHHICLNVFHPPTPTRKALRCRGLRVNRCPAGHLANRRAFQDTSFRTCYGLGICPGHAARADGGWTCTESGWRCPQGHQFTRSP